MKLTINGTPAELAKLMLLLSDPESLADAAEQQKEIVAVTNRISKTVDELQNQTIDKANTLIKVVEDHQTQIETDLKYAKTATAETPTAETPKTRTRRTKEQIEADKKAAEVDPADVDQGEPVGVSTPADHATLTETGGVDMDMIGDMVMEKGQQKKKAEIIAELAKYGAKRASDLESKDWNKFYIFLQAL